MNKRAVAFRVLLTVVLALVLIFSLTGYFVFRGGNVFEGSDLAGVVGDINEKINFIDLYLGLIINDVYSEVKDSGDAESEFKKKLSEKLEVMRVDLSDDTKIDSYRNLVGVGSVLSFPDFDVEEVVSFSVNEINVELDVKFVGQVRTKEKAFWDVEARKVRMQAKVFWDVVKVETFKKKKEL